MTNKNSHRDNESSSEKINYLVRPAKQVERKLIVEALHYLYKIYEIKKYEYIGMGSLFYIDYKMFHKYLGIRSMISMEKEEKTIKRFEFNKPYDFIKLIPGISTEILPTLDWDKDLIIWLDYDSPVSLGAIDDIYIISNYIRSGSILIITFDAEPRRFDFETEENKELTTNGKRLMNFKDRLHPYYPSDIKVNDLAVLKYPLLLNRIILNAIKDKIKFRDLNFHQIFNFSYKDTANMYTFGCIFDNDFKKVKSTGIFKLDFISNGSSMVKINIPIITPLEKLYFDKLIPNISSRLNKFDMDLKKLNDYEKYYKFYPQYFETFL